MTYEVFCRYTKTCLYFRGGVLNSSDVLKQIIDDRKQVNPKLSLRSIAKRMKIPSGRLCEILSGKRRLTDYYLEKACAALKLSPVEMEQIRKTHYHLTESRQSHKPYGQLLNDNQIQNLSDWRPYAVMSFLGTVPYEELTKKANSPTSQIPWIAKKLGLAEQDVSSVIKLLADLSLIHWEENGWRPNHRNMSTGYDIPNKWIQNGHLRDLELAQRKLFAVPVPKRDFSSITIAIDPKDLTKAKKMIREFRREFSEVLERGEKHDVYQLSIQFFPVSEVTEL